MDTEAKFTAAGMYWSGPDEYYRVPDELSVTPFSLRRMLFIGSCFAETLGAHLQQMMPEADFDTILFNHAGALPAEPPRPVADYDCQVLFLPLREIMQEHLTMRLRSDDLAGWQSAFAESTARLDLMLNGALAFWRRSHLLTFVATYPVPQQNGVGRLMPRRDLRNPVFYVEELNRLLIERVDALSNAYLLDLDSISANFGRRYMQDDATWLFSHGTVMDDWDFDHDANRLEVAMRASELDRTQPRLFVRALLREVSAMVRSVRQIDQVKLVAVDLDDTLWRGVIAEDGLSNPALTEGWPIALAEALLYLQRRGILLAVVSKNDASVVEAAWDTIFMGRLKLEDFAVRQINWSSKAENIGEICRKTNLLPASVVFIDDNPAERAAVQAAYPDVRVLGANPLLTRRILLWAPETQTAAITAESERRTEMIQAQIERDDLRGTLSREQFLASLALTVEGDVIMSVADSRFARAVELVNKSNQFNTTGARWTAEMAATLFAEGGAWHVFDVSDRFTRYGLVGVAIVREPEIEQFVMSCRVFGLDAEIAMIAQVATLFGSPATQVRAAFAATPRNSLARDLFIRCGFVQAGTGFVLLGLPTAVPPHVRSVPRPAADTGLDAGVNPWRRLVQTSARLSHHVLHRDRT